MPSHKRSYSPRVKVRLPLYTDGLSQETYISPLLARRAHRRATAYASTNKRLHSPKIKPLNTYLAKHSVIPATITPPPPLPRSKEPSQAPAFLEYPLEGPVEWPPCPIKVPHLHGDLNPYRPYRHRNLNPHLREINILRQFEATHLWEGGNPPREVWDALFRILLGEETEWEGDDMIVFAYRYWHCSRFRQECLAEDAREEAKLNDAMATGKW